MTDITSSAGIVDGFVRGPVRTPVNRARPSPMGAATGPGAGSIHDDATAQRLGFRGGTIAGSVHMDQFPPVLLEAFDPTWFEAGSLSLSFVQATIGGDPVVALVAVPPRPTDVQVAARMEQPDGTLVAEGTAAAGAAGEPTNLETVDLRPGDPDDLRLLNGVRPGDPLAAHDVTLDPALLRARIDAGAFTEPLDWYTGQSPWGGPIANPSSVVQLLRNRGRDFGPHVAEAVGLFGAIEIRHHAGPVFFDTPYRVSGEVVAVGSSPKTEYVWFDNQAHDRDGRLVASMRMQLRWMKASSPLYQKA